VTVSASDELRIAEYGQRLHTLRRNVARTDGASIGGGLLRAAVRGGTRALGLSGPGALARGAPADLLVLDPHDPRLAAREGDALLDAWIFAGDSRSIRDVMVAGRWCIRDHHHASEDALEAAYVK